MQVSAIGSGGMDVASVTDLMEQMKQKFFEKIDTKADGVIDSDELSKLASSTNMSADDIIKTYDKDQDGGLNATEFDAMMKEVRPKFRPEGMQGPPPPPPDRDQSTSGVSNDTNTDDQMKTLVELLKEGKTDEAKTALQTLLANNSQAISYGASAASVSSSSLIHLTA